MLSTAPATCTTARHPASGSTRATAAVTRSVLVGIALSLGLPAGPLLLHLAFTETLLLGVSALTGTIDPVFQALAVLELRLILFLGNLSQLLAVYTFC